MKPPSGPNKTNPNKANFTYPQRGKTEVRCRMSEVRYLSSAFCFLSSVHGHLLVNRMKPKFLDFLLKNSFDSLAEFGKMLYMLDVQQFC